MNGTKETRGGGARASTRANERGKEGEAGGRREDWTTLGVGERVDRK